MVYSPGNDIWQVRLTPEGLRYIEGLLDEHDNQIPVESCLPLEEQSAENG